MDASLLVLYSAGLRTEYLVGDGHLDQAFVLFSFIRPEAANERVTSQSPHVV